VNKAPTPQPGQAKATTRTMHTEDWSPAPAALTFDDGSDPVWTSLVLDALTDAGAQATFFVVAPRATRYRSLISSMRRAVVAARELLSGRRHVVVERRTLPEEMPDGPFDPIVASEILYCCTREEMLATSRVFERELAGGGVLLAVHWRSETKTYPLRGDEVHELLLGRTRLHNSKTIVEPDYRLDLFEDPA
jgi:peptidoglycan/xylan/chitin deacetylase (PgdA/CDA1 family)